MTDYFLSRAYADNHHRVSGDIAAAIGTFFSAVGVALDRLHAYQFDAPWRHQHTDCAAR